MKGNIFILGCIIIIGLFCGCGQKADASSYLKAYLDNCYKRNADSLVSMSGMTEAEAIQVRQQVLDDELKSFAGAFGMNAQKLMGIDDELSDVLFRTKYSVGEAVEQTDGSFIVTVTYEQVNFYGPTIDAYKSQSNTLSTSWDALGESVSQGVKDNDTVVTLKSIMGVTLLSVTYDLPQTIDIRVTGSDGVYKVNEEDLKKLDYNLLDNQDANLR